MNWMMVAVAAGLMVFSVGGTSGLAAPTIDFQTLPPSGIITSPPGSKVGWGYTLSNGSATDWLVTTSLNTDAFVAAVPNLIFDFPVLSPGSSVTVPYDPSTGAGLLELVWDTSAPPGLTNSGMFILSADWWTNDPLHEGALIASAGNVSHYYQATVVSSVPEPVTLPILGLVLSGMLLGRRNWVLSPALSKTRRPTPSAGRNQWPTE